MSHHLAEWIAEAREQSLPPLRFPPPVPLFPHQDFGARRIVHLLRTRGGALLFDGVGMGKSFTAAAVARELAREEWSIHFAVPAPLVTAWESCLARFGVEAPILTHDGFASVEERVRAPALLVVDEAHRFRNPATRRWRALARWSIGRALLLITATPIWNEEADLLALLRLAFPDDAFRREGQASVDAAFDRKDGRAIRSIVALAGVRRSPEIERIRFPGAATELFRYRQSGRRELAESIFGLSFPLLEGQAALLRSFLLGRLDSGLTALVDSLRRQRRFCRRAAESLRRGFTLQRRELERVFHPEDRELFQDLLFPSVFLRPVSCETDVLEELVQETRRLDRLIDYASAMRDEKLEQLIALLRRVELPAVLFTRSRATARDVYDAARRVWRAALVSSSEVLDSRGVRVSVAEAAAELRRRNCDLLVLTDLGSEGLDLQAAATVIHYDLPWTAVKMRQRSGRAVRIGQTRPEVRVICFLPKGDERSTTLPFIGRKRRIENRLLIADPIRSPGRDDAPAVRQGSVAAGEAVLEVRSGAVLVREPGSLSADPLRLVELLGSVVELRAVGPGSGSDSLAEPPPRVMRGKASRRDIASFESTRILEALAVRNRSGVEVLMAGVTDRRSWMTIEEVLLAEPGQRGDWKSGAPVR